MCQFLHRAPKQWCLSKSETINSFKNWRQNLLYTLSLDRNFAPFLAEGITWGKRTRTEPLRGFTDDGEDVAEASHLTAQQKVNFLELMPSNEPITWSDNLSAAFCEAQSALSTNRTITLPRPDDLLWIPYYRKLTLVLINVLEINAT